MREFFKGWRRKLGCVALVMAISACVQWWRSYVLIDQVEVAVGGKGLVVQSKHGRVLCLSLDIQMGCSWHSEPHHSKIHTDFFRDKWLHRFSHSIHWYREICGVTFGVGHFFNPTMTFHAMQFDYWPVASLLVAISAALILWPVKRESRPPPGATPHP